MYKNLNDGYFYLDNFVYHDKTLKTSNYDLLRNLRYYTIDKMLLSKQHKKAIKERDDTDFFDTYKPTFDKYMKDIDISLLYDLKYNEKNKKLIKDMLILTTYIKDTYERR
ncbi:MAG: hypothetical protein Q9M43_09990 [Sulfurimonas sp.]|nr:hypothetical protein [Sulfurimonas sp.]